jgi:hypothetical protein
MVDLDHAPGKTSYLGLAHRSCNRAAGARIGNRSPLRRQRRGAPKPTNPTSRDW